MPSFVRNLHASALVEPHATVLNGWLGPPWIKEGWFHSGDMGKLDEDGKGGFVLAGTGQNLQQVVEECLSKHYGRKIEL